MVLATIAWVVLGLVELMRKYFGMPSSFTLLQHQRGVLYRRGMPGREVGAGRHGVWVGVEKILFLDTRPVSVNVENRAVTLADGSTAVYGFSGSAEVTDVRKALYCAGNYNEMPAFVLLSCARAVLNNQRSVGLLTQQQAIAEQITERARMRLAISGFGLLTFRITQLSLASPAASTGKAFVH